MAAEYGNKLAALHEETAARAQIEMRKRQERYALLVNLQAQAQVCLSQTYWGCVAYPLVASQVWHIYAPLSFLLCTVGRFAPPADQSVS